MRKKNQRGTQNLVDHHVLYQSESHPRAQGEIKVLIGAGDHMVITDVQHRIAKDNEAIGWCLLFEGIKRIMQGRLSKLDKEASRCNTKKNMNN